MKEENVTMITKCIQFDMECAVLCYASAQLIGLGSDKAKELCALCATICNACADVRGKHDNQHCKECADACRYCAMQ